MNKETMVADGEHFAMPVSIAQQRIWIRSHRVDNSLWNVAVRFRLRGELSSTSLETALYNITISNEILRTYFSICGGTLAQIIYAPVAVPMPSADLSTLPQDEREDEIQRISVLEASRVSDPGVAPLWRARLIRLNAREHVLLVTMHHAISDGWSIGLFSNELMKAYEEVLQNVPVDNGANRPQYADYSIWLGQRRTTAEYREHGEFWNRYILNAYASAPDTLPQPACNLRQSAISSALLPIDLTDSVKRFASRHQATFYHVALSAFAVLRMIHTKEHRVVIGTPVSGRESVESESIIGPFVNYIPLLMTYLLDTSVKNSVRSTADTLAELLPHSEYRYEDMLLDAGMQRELFECVFICQRDFISTVCRGDVELSAMPSVTPGCLYDLTLYLVEREDGWRLSCEVDTAKFSTDQARELLQTYTCILQEMLHRPTGTIGELIAQVTHAETDKQTGQLVSHHDDNHAALGSSRSSASPTAVFPASESQTQYWLLDQSRPDRTTFHLRVRLMIEGRLNPVYVAETLAYLVRRHDILRTTFIMEGESLRQYVHDLSFPVNFEYRKEAVIPGAELEHAIESILTNESRWECDLKSGPLFRTLLVDLGSDRALLSMTLAHLIADGWSCGILQREFEHVYGAFCNGQLPNLVRLTTQYRDAALLEKSSLLSSEARISSEYWKGRLDGRLPILDLPADMGVKQTGPANGACEFLAVSPECDALVRRQAKELGTTPFVVYGAVFQALISRYCGAREITFNTPFANRTEETEDVIGPFSMSVPLRCTVDERWSIRSYIESLQGIVIDALDHALPLDRCAESVSLTSRNGRHALNQLCFFYQKAFVRGSRSSGLHFTPLAAAPMGSGFEWQVAVIERDGSVSVEFHYDANLYSRNTIQTAATHYVNLILKCLTSPTKPVKEMEFASPEEIDAAAKGRQLLPISRRALGIAPIAAGEADVRTVGVPAASPESAVTSHMINIWERVFRHSGFERDTDFFESGGHSLIFARLQVLIQKELGFRMKTEDILAAPTIGSLAERLASTGSSSARTGNPRVIPIRADGTQPPLFLISQSMIFRRMAEHLGSDQPVFAVRMQDEDVAHCGADASFEAIGRYYADVIRAVRPGGPYRVGGWCVAGWLAYEVAQSLLAQGEEVELLVIIDAWAPGYWRDMIGRQRLFAMLSYYWSRLKLHARSIWSHPLSDSLAVLGERAALGRIVLKRLTASIFGSTGRRMIADDAVSLVDKSTYSASRTYQPRPTSVKTLLFRSTEQPSGPYLAEDMGWSKLLGRRPRITTLAGDHQQIFDDPGAAALATEISLALSAHADKAGSDAAATQSSSGAISAIGHTGALCPLHSR
jgi:thioesterase domain-containing protein/NRPS condensation-like uncharacterized protein